MDKEKIQELDMKVMEVIEMIAEGMDKGYEDEYVEALYITKDSLKKLEKIRHIFNEWASTGDNADGWAFREIRKVLENE